MNLNIFDTFKSLVNQNLLISILRLHWEYRDEAVCSHRVTLEPGSLSFNTLKIPIKGKGTSSLNP